MSARDFKLLTLTLERALLAMEKRHGEGLVLRRFASVYGVAQGDLEAWLAQFNGGETELRPGTVARVKRELGILSESRAEKPAARPNQGAPARTQASAPAVTRPALAQAPTSPAAAATSAPVARGSLDDGASPWEKHPQGPRRKSLAAARPVLEQLAGGHTVPTVKGNVAKFLLHWMGTTRPAATKVCRFISWIDGRGANTPVEKPARATTEKAPRRIKRLPANTETSSRRPAAPLDASSGDGWRQLDVRTGNFSAVALRYSGAGVRHPGLSISKLAVRSLRLDLGARVSVNYHHGLGRLALVPSAEAGLVLRRQRTGGVRIVCKTMPELLGAEVRNFNLSTAKVLAASIAEFVEVRS